MNTDKKDMILDLESTEITDLGRLSDAIEVRSTRHETIPKLLAGATGGVTEHRRQALLQILAKLPDDDVAKLRVDECADEKTGARYGQAKCRVGRCEKIGGGGRNRGSRYSYQLWAVWS